MHNFNQLSPHELAQLPTEVDILQYEQRGWYISPYVIENSHHWDLNNGLKQFCAHGVKDLSLFEDYLQHSGLTYRSVPITIKKGQTSFHHCNAFHGSATNQSNLRRMSLTIHFQDEKNAYHPVHNESGDRIIIGYDKICREDEHGYPDYHDPNIFPILWNEYE